MHRIPHVGMLGDDLEQRFFSTPADHQRNARLLQRLGITDGIRHAVLLALEGGFVLGEHAGDDLTCFVEPLETSAKIFEVDPEAAMLQLVPAGAQAEIEPAAACVIERGGHLRGQARVAIGVAVDERTDTGAPGVLAERAQQCPVLHAGAGGVGREDRIEMIERPERVIAPGVEFRPDVAHPLPSYVLLPGLESKSNRMPGHLFCDLRGTGAVCGCIRWVQPQQSVCSMKCQFLNAVSPLPIAFH